jgi:hypothetical protein
MLYFGIILSCLLKPTIGAGQLEAHLRSADVNAAYTEGSQQSEARLRYAQALELQSELSEIPANVDSSLVAGSEGAEINSVEADFKVPADNWSPEFDRGVAASTHKELSLPQQAPGQVYRSAYRKPARKLPDNEVDFSLWKGKSDTWRDPVIEEEQKARASTAEEGEGADGSPSLVKEGSEKKETTESEAGSQKENEGLAETVAPGTNGEELEPKMADAGTTESAQDIKTLRPNAAANRPDYVHFGLFAKTFYGVNLKENNFNVDVVMTLKWIDHRVISLIPTGSDEMTLSKKESEQQIWLPGMVITNRDIKRHDLISTAVMINRKGEVFKVERVMVTVKNVYKLKDYPYDTQKLVVKIASSKYMLDEVVLKPAKAGVGVAPDLLKGYNYDFVDVGAKAIEDISGALSKSRGLLTITIKRDSTQYFNGHMIPVFLVASISCGVHWFPFVAPFITPRVALCILALLAFTNLMLQSSSQLPTGAPFNWNDCFNQIVLAVMFLNVCMNIFAETCLHQIKVDDLARTINHELKVVMPSILALGICIVTSAAGPNGWMSLGMTSCVVKTMIGLLIGSYVLYCVSRVNVALEQKRTEAGKEQCSA